MTTGQVVFRLCELLVLLMIGVTAFTTRHYAFMPGVIGLLGTFALVFSKDHEFRYPVRLGFLLLSFVALGLLSSLWSINAPETIERALKVGGVFLGGWFFIALCMNYPLETLGQKAKFLPAMFLFVVLFLVMDLVSGMPIYLMIHDLGPEFSEHYFEYNKEIGAVIFLFPTALTFSYFYWHRAGVIALLIPVLFLLTLSASQSAQLAFVVGLGVFAIFKYFPGQWKPAWTAIGTIIIAGILSSPFIAPWLFRNTAELFMMHPLLVDSAASPRLEIWDFIGRKIQEHPFSGYGMYATRFIEDFETRQLYYKSSTLMHPHNSALQLWLEFGVAGALAGAGAAIYLLSSCFKAEKPALSRLYFSLFCMLLIVSLLGWGLWQAWWLGLVFAASGLTILAGRFVFNR